MSWLPNNIASPLAAFFSIEGYTLSQEEIDLFRSANPLGFILFKRNINNRQQARQLTDDLRECLGWDCPILIDQEGGRVNRLPEEQWKPMPAAAHFGEMFNAQGHDSNADIMEAYDKLAQNLVEIGVNVNCAPTLDILYPQTPDAIGSTRVFGDTAETVMACGEIMCEAMLQNNITPVIKHMPGHGRGAADSHFDLPVIDASINDLKDTDFKPFKTIAKKTIAQFIWGMTSHLLFTKIDPTAPVSISSKMINEIIRDEIGFQGFLISDDIDMKGLANFSPVMGDVDKRSLAALQAGTDAIVYCAGHINDMTILTNALPRLSDDAIDRFNNSRNQQILAHV